MNEGAPLHPLTIKGVGDSLMVALGDAGWDQELTSLLEQITGQEAFFSGARLAVDVGPRVLRAAELDLLRKNLTALKVNLSAVLSCAPSTLYSARMLGIPTTLELARIKTIDNKGSDRKAQWVQGPLSPGCRLISEFDLVIIGNVETGMFVEAAGSILVWGRLKGSVHAGMGGNESAVVSALIMKPSQLRIANMYFIPKTRISPLRPETARICRGLIILEPWNKEK